MKESPASAAAVSWLSLGFMLGWAIGSEKKPAPVATPSASPAAPTADRMPEMIAATRDEICKAAAVEAIIVECVRRCRAPNP